MELATKPLQPISNGCTSTSQPQLLDQHNEAFSVQKPPHGILPRHSQLDEGQHADRN